MGIRYANNYFFELMDWIYVKYVQIMPVYLMSNQYEMKVEYNIKYPIEILFYHMEMGQ